MEVQDQEKEYTDEHHMDTEECQCVNRDTYGIVKPSQDVVHKYVVKEHPVIAAEAKGKGRKIQEEQRQNRHATNERQDAGLYSEEIEECV